jgi:hypothetical protein
MKIGQRCSIACVAISRGKPSSRCETTKPIQNDASNLPASIGILPKQIPTVGEPGAFLPHRIHAYLTDIGSVGTDGEMLTAAQRLQGVGCRCIPVPHLAVRRISSKPASAGRLPANCAGRQTNEEVCPMLRHRPSCHGANTLPYLYGQRQRTCALPALLVVDDIRRPRLSTVDSDNLHFISRQSPHQLT